MQQRVSEPGARQALRMVTGETSQRTPSSILDAHSAAEAVALLGMHGPLAVPLARGEDLLELLQDGVLSPRVLVNLATAADLARMERCAQGLRIGAMVTLDRIAQDPSAPPMLLDAVEHTSRLSTNATLGGNLLQRPQCMYFRNATVDCFKKGGATCPGASAPPELYPGALYPGVCHAAHPSDLAPALIALDAQAEIVAWDGARRPALGDLYRDAAFNREREARLAQDELLSAVIVPDSPASQGFVKVSIAGCAAVSAAAVLEIDGERIVDVRIVASGVAPGPFVFSRASDLIADRRVKDLEIRETARDLVQAEARLPTAARAVAAREAIEGALSRALQRG